MCFLIMDMFEDIIRMIICKDAFFTKMYLSDRNEKGVFENATGNNKGNVRESL